MKLECKEEKFSPVESALILRGLHHLKSFSIVENEDIERLMSKIKYMSK